MPEWLITFLHWLSLPEIGLSTVFLVALISATWLPLGSEPAVFGLVKLNPELFWPAMLVATGGNTLGGMFNWWLGMNAHKVMQRLRGGPADVHARVLVWLQRLGPKACLLSWLPVLGDPLCSVAGYLRMPALPCMAYMAVGKLARYVVLTAVLLYLI